MKLKEEISTTDMILSSVFGSGADRDRLIRFFAKEKMTTYDNQDKPILGHKARQKAALERKSNVSEPRISIHLCVPTGQMNYNDKPQRAVKGLHDTTSKLLKDRVEGLKDARLFVVIGPSTELKQVFDFWKNVKVIDKNGKKVKPNPDVMAECIVSITQYDRTFITK